MVDAPEQIWLQNAEDAKHQCEGRLWCQDKVWPNEPEEGEPTRYIRADIAERQLAEARAERDNSRVSRAKYDDLLRAHGIMQSTLTEQQERAKKEYDRATAAEAERDRLAAKVERLTKERDALAKAIDPADNRPALMARIIMKKIELTVAAEPFATFAEYAVERVNDCWMWKNSSNERICDWFGPSDFGDLRAALVPAERGE